MTNTLSSSSSSSSRPNSFINRSTTTTPPSQSLRISSGYSNNNSYRPLNSYSNNSSTYGSSSFLHEQPDSIRILSTNYKPYDSLYEPYLSSRLNALRTGRYVSPIMNRFNLP